MKFLNRLLALAGPIPAANIALPVYETAVDDTDAAAEKDAAIRATAAQEVKDRCRAIFECPEAEGRATLTRHIALATTITLDEARKCLAASPREAVEVLADTESMGVSERAERQQRADANFSEAYRRADYAIQEPAKPETTVERMRKHYALARGEKPDAR